MTELKVNPVSLLILWQSAVYCGTGYLFHKMPHFPGKWSGNLFLSKGIRIVGVEPAKLLYPVPIPQNATFSVEV